MFITKKKHQRMIGSLIEMLNIQREELDMAADALQQVVDKTMSGEFIKNPNFKLKTKKKEGR